VSEFSAKAAEMTRDKHVRDGMKKEREEDEHELRLSQEIVDAEARLSSPDRGQALAELRDRWKHLAAMADGPEDTADRRLARRVLRGLAMSVSERTTDPQYLRIVQEYRPARVNR
jgi:hypothetical protein